MPREWGSWSSTASSGARYRVGFDWSRSGRRVSVSQYVFESEYSISKDVTLRRTGDLGGTYSVGVSTSGGVVSLGHGGSVTGNLGGSVTIGGRVTDILHGLTCDVSLRINIPAEVPDAPQAPVPPATLTATSVYISWFAPNNNGASIDDYQVRIERGGSTIQAENTGGRPNQWFYGLDKNTRYGARVRAHNSAGWGGYSNFRYFTTDATAPGRPDRPVADTITDTSMRWVWQVNSDDGGMDRTAWRLQVATDSSFNNIVENRYESNQVRNHTVTGLEPNTTYYARVRIYNAIGGSDYSLVGSATTDVGVPGVVRNLRVLDKGVTTVTVGWDPPSNNGGAPIDHYRVSRDGDFFIVEDLDAYFTHLTPGSEHFVNVQAHNSAGYGPWVGRLYFTMLAGVWVGTGTEWRPAIIHVGNGTDWEQAQARVGDGSQWRS